MGIRNVGVGLGSHQQKHGAWNAAAQNAELSPDPDALVVLWVEASPTLALESRDVFFEDPLHVPVLRSNRPHEPRALQRPIGRRHHLGHNLLNKPVVAA